MGSAGRVYYYYYISLRNKRKIYWHIVAERYDLLALNEDNNSIDIPSFFGIIGHFVLFIYGKKKIEKCFFNLRDMNLAHFYEEVNKAFLGVGIER